LFSLAIQFQAHADIVKIISKIFAIQKPCFIFISKLLQLQQCEIFRRYENASVLQFNSKHIVEQFLFTIQPTFFELGGGGQQWSLLVTTLWPNINLEHCEEWLDLPED
jgi:hypothetical protein